MADKPEDRKEDEDFKTFDMYRCFSRLDVVLAICFVVGFLLLILFYVLTPQPV